MFINKIKLQNFRGFKKREFSFDRMIVVVEGDNGSGKTTLLESLYYTCFLRSFRTNQVKDLVSIEDKYFFTHLEFEDEQRGLNQIQVGLSTVDGKLVKLNKRPIISYKQIISSYKVISIAEDELSLIRGNPEERRTFLNQFLLLINPEFINDLRQYKQVLQHRNSILKDENKSKLSFLKNDEFYIWSKQLWEVSIKIQKKRVLYLNELKKEVNFLLEKYLDKEGFTIDFEYKYKKNVNIENFDEFWANYQKKLKSEELKWGRSLFGAHLDDFSIIFQRNYAKSFASRGEQKLILLLLKVAQIMILKVNGTSAILLIDDFLTDFDKNRAKNCLKILDNIDTQTFITCPLKSYITTKFSKSSKIQVISL